MINMELMAPAGSYDALMAAIKAGANSVYFGVEQLNMRTKSTHNFTLSDLPNIAQICKVNGLKSYLTLNTIVYDHDMSLMQKILDASKENAINAVIASDHAVMNYAKKIGLTIHISTQCNITNIETVEFYANYADVVVMSRELSLLQVETINKEIKRRNITGPSGSLVRTEVFGHGALCMAVSGKCYLSLHSNFSSANRGACVQNCRKTYIVTDKEEGTEFEVDNEYIMSAKDLCVIDFLDKVIKSGVSVLKIEGRGRSADYVYTTTKCYREAIDAYYNGTYTREKVLKWKEQLSTVFNRGFWDGYYLGRTMGEWSDDYGSKATKRKVYIGKGLKYYDEAKIGEFYIEAQGINIGDELIISGPTTGIVETIVSEMRKNNISVSQVKRGETITFPLSEKVRPSDKLYKLISVK